MVLPSGDDTWLSIFERYNLERYIDVSNDWTKNDDKISITFEIYIFLKTYKSVDIKKNVTSKTIILSNEQSEVLDICRYQLNKLKNINDCGNKKISYLKRIIVQGKAGTGKSTLISEIVETVRETLGHDAIIVTAPTGAAAVNINGNTIHSSEFHII